MSRNGQFRVAVRKFGPFETSLEKQWASFCRSANCDLELARVPLDLHPLHEALFENRGLTNGDWDVVHLSTDWMAEAHESGGLVDLRPHVATNPPDGYPDAWAPSVLGIQHFADALLGLPFHDGPEVLIFRRDLFEDGAEREAFRHQFGRELVVPETWKEFSEVARFFNRPEDGLHGTVFAAFPDGHNTVYDFALQTWTHGGSLVDGSGRVVVDSPEAAAGLDFYRALLQDTGAVHPGCRDFDSVKSGFTFAAGEVAMMVNWFGFASMCEVIPESRVKGCVDIAPIPSIPGTPPVSLNCYWVYGIPSGGPNTALAWEFVRRAVSAENDKLLTLEGAIGCRKSTWSDSEVNQTVPYYHRLEQLHHNARTLPRKANWTELSSVVDQLVLDAINSDRPVAELLAEAQKKLDCLQS